MLFEKWIDFPLDLVKGGPELQLRVVPVRGPFHGMEDDFVIESLTYRVKCPLIQSAESGRISFSRKSW